MRQEGMLGVAFLFIADFSGFNLSIATLLLLPVLGSVGFGFS